MKLIKADALKIEQKKADFWRHTKSVGEGPLLLKCPEKLTFDPIAANVRFPPILSLSASGPKPTLSTVFKFCGRSPHCSHSLQLLDLVRADDWTADKAADHLKK